jgi:hypothetical protein
MIPASVRIWRDYRKNLSQSKSSSRVLHFQEKKYTKNRLYFNFEYMRFFFKFLLVLVFVLHYPIDNTAAAAWAGWPTKVYVTSKVPGADCVCVVPPYASTDDFCGWPKLSKFECEVGTWLSAFQNMFREIVQWAVYIIMLLGVLAIAGAGILWAFGSDSEEYTKKAKWWVTNIIVWLFILFTFRYILGFLAPWIFQ